MASSTNSWFHSFAPFRTKPSRALNSGIKQVEKPIHPHQSVERVWTVTKSLLDNHNTSDAIAGLIIQTPGLTIVSVNPHLPAAVGADVIARVRMTSDKREHLEWANVTVSKKNECSVEYKAKKGAKGKLVTEITVATAVQLSHIVAMGGGDVVLQENVIGQQLPPYTPTDGELQTPLVQKKQFVLVSLCGSQVYVVAPNADLKLDDLVIGTMGSNSSVHLEARTLNIQNHIAGGIVGTGRIHVSTQQLKTNETHLHAIGSEGTIQLLVTQSLDTGSLESSVRGNSSVDVSVHPDAAVASTKQKLQVSRGGRIDVTDVPSQSTSVKVRSKHGGNVEIRAPHTELSVESCHQAGVVGYAGDLPSLVHTDEKTTLIPLAVSESQVRVFDAASLPTIVSAFASEVPLEKASEGFWSTVVRPFFAH